MTVVINLNWEAAVEHCLHFLSLECNSEKEIDYVKDLLSQYEKGTRTEHLYNKMLSDFGE